MKAATAYFIALAFVVGYGAALLKQWLKSRGASPEPVVVYSPTGKPPRAGYPGFKPQGIKPHLRFEPSLGMWVCTEPGDLGFGMGRTPSEAFAEFQADEWPYGQAAPPTPWGLP